MMYPRAALLAALLAAHSLAQAPAITEERVRETVAWLAADERAGRDTGSAELQAARDWIAARFAAAGLVQVQEGSWLHEFPMTGWLLDSKGIQVRLERAHRGDPQVLTLVADQDVRQWTVADLQSGEDEGCTVALADDAVLQRMLLAGASRRPIFCEVAEDDPRWLRAAGAHRVLAGRRQASRPVFLVKKGVLPAAPDDGSEVQWKATWSVPVPEKAEVPQHNVLGLLRGTSKKDEYVVVSAHYDHVGIGAEVAGDRIYNGADDNATGTTAVLLLAEALAKEAPPARSVLFVCFTGEERGLLGSRAFCARPPVPLDRITTNLNLEMLGRPEPGKEGKAWITGHELSDFAAIATQALQRAGVEVVGFPMATRLFAASDNYAFAQKGIVAHSLSAGSLHADYHRPGDEVDKLDIPHMTRIVRGLLEVTKELANREQPPQWNEMGRAMLGPSGR